MDSPMDNVFSNPDDAATKLLNELNGTFQQMAANNQLTGSDVLMMQACMTSLTLQASLFSQLSKRLELLEVRIEELSKSPFE